VYQKSVSSVRDRVPSREAADDVFDIERLLLIVRRQVFLVMICGAIGFIGAIAYALQVTPLYSASANLVLGDPAALTEGSNGYGSSVLADTMIAGQVELLRSTRVATRVVDAIGADRLGSETPVGPIDQLRAFLRSLLPQNADGQVASGATDPDISPELSVALDLQKAVSISRIGRSPAIVIGYTSDNPALAHEVPNQYAASYIADLEDAIAQRAARSREWLNERTRQLQQEVFEAELAVEEFRRIHSLPQTGTESLPERLLVQLNAQLSEALGAVIQAESLAAQLEQMGTDPQQLRIAALPAEFVAGDSGEELRQLRDDYLAVRSRLSDLSGRVGSEHPEVLALTNERERLGQRLSTHLQSIGDIASDTAQQARQRVAMLRSEITGVTERSLSNAAENVQLSHLQHTVQSYRNMLDSAMAQAQQSDLAASVPQAVAQVISPANPPQSPVWPRKIPIALTGLMLGLILGGALALYREFRERYYRTGEQLVADLGTEFFGSLPTLRDWPSLTGFKAERAPASDSRLLMWNDRSKLDVVETFRRALLSIAAWDDKSKGRIVGVISALPDEGKSTFAINVARLQASYGKKTVLIDADFRKPSIARSLKVTPAAGLVEILLGAARLEDVMTTDDQTDLCIIPSLPSFNSPRVAQLIASSEMDKLLNDLAHSFDQVIIDLPPLSLLSDARALAPSIDGFFLVVRWGRTPRRLVQDILQAHPIIRSKLFGCVLNRVNLRRLKRYLPFGAAERYRGNYRAYGYTALKKSLS
jgi:polysaccharide biosynthesis transport protein